MMIEKPKILTSEIIRVNAKSPCCCFKDVLLVVAIQ